MAWPIVKVTSGGIAVTEVTNGFGTPVEVAANGYGTPVTYVTAGGIPVSTGGGSVQPNPPFPAPSGYAWASVYEGSDPVYEGTSRVIELVRTN